MYMYLITKSIGTVEHETPTNIYYDIYCIYLLLMEQRLLYPVVWIY